MNIDASAAAVIAVGLNIAVTLIGGGIAYGRVSTRLDAHDADTKRIEDGLHELRSLLVSSAVEADRLRRAEADIQNLEEDVRNLRRGIGFINDRNEKSVDREY